MPPRIFAVPDTLLLKGRPKFEMTNVCETLGRRSLGSRERCVFDPNCTRHYNISLMKPAFMLTLPLPNAQQHGIMKMHRPLVGSVAYGLGMFVPAAKDATAGKIAESAFKKPINSAGYSPVTAHNPCPSTRLWQCATCIGFVNDCRRPISLRTIEGAYEWLANHCPACFRDVHIDFPVPNLGAGDER